MLIKPDGSVRDTEVLGGNPILAESAQKSVWQWKFSPAGSETNREVFIVFDPNATNQRRRNLVEPAAKPSVFELRKNRASIFVRGEGCPVRLFLFSARGNGANQNFSCNDS